MALAIHPDETEEWVPFEDRDYSECDALAAKRNELLSPIKTVEIPEETRLELERLDAEIERARAAAPPKPSATIFVIGAIPQVKFGPASARYIRATEGIRAADADGRKFDEFLEREGGRAPEIAESALGLIRLGLRGWSNLKDRRGREIPFDMDRAGDFFPMQSISALANRIIVFNTMTADELGNSDSAS